MLDDFLVRATLAGIGLAVVAAPLGCFVVWRRMAFFGEATAHVAILGIAMAFALSLPIFPSILTMTILMALALSWGEQKGGTTDSFLGVFAHGALAIGLVVITFVPGQRLDLMVFLVGDILAVDRMDLMVIFGAGIAVIAVLAWRWQALLTSTTNPDLAFAAGINPNLERTILTLCLAVFVAIAIKAVGVLLIAALLIIPATAARPLARTPEQMVVIAAVLGMLAVGTGMQFSIQTDAPTGPSIVVLATVILVITHLVKRRS